MRHQVDVWNGPSPLRVSVHQSWARLQHPTVTLAVHTQGSCCPSQKQRDAVQVPVALFLHLISSLFPTVAISKTELFEHGSEKDRLRLETRHPVSRTGDGTRTGRRGGKLAV